MNPQATTLEKIVLLVLTGICVVALTLIAMYALKGGKVDPNTATLVGVIVTALSGTATLTINTIRSYATSAQLTRATDQLAGSKPIDEKPIVPPGAIVTAAAKDPDIAPDPDVTLQPGESTTIAAEGPTS